MTLGVDIVREMSMTNKFIEFKYSLLLKKFWIKVDVKSKDECWNWTGLKSPRGYGIIRINKSPRRANRVSYFLEHGYFDKNLFICHVCDNPSCVNPGHLFIGNHQTNMDDRFNKGRYLKTTHCSNGHEYVEGSYYTRMYKSSRTPSKICNKCKNIRNRFFIERKRLGQSSSQPD